MSGFPSQPFYIFTRAGQNATQERVRRILATEYTTGRGGLPGNDDSGAMSSWYVWTAMGLYPNARTALLLHLQFVV